MTMLCHDDGSAARQLLALRPRGDAWRNGGHDAAEGSTIGHFFAALGSVFGPVERRFCALIDEFFCSTAVETLDIWALEYGMPDGCDPFADVCEKVNAVGDSIPNYAIFAAQRRGWVIIIEQEWITKVQSCRMGQGRMGMLRMGAAQGVAWRIRINLAASPAYVASSSRKSRMGRMRMGFAFYCGPAIDPLACLIRRIAPAHADLVFESF